MIITTTEIPKRTTTDVRDSYVLFNIKANRNVSNYHLAVKKKEQRKPTATEMMAGALKRNLSTNSINVLIAQRLDAPIITFAKTHLGNISYTSLGTGMNSLSNGNGDIGLIYDNTANKDNAWVNQSLLEPDVTYTLYGMEEGTTEVKMLNNFATDATAVPGSIAASANVIYTNTDSTLAKNHITISVNQEEYYIFPLQGDLDAGSLDKLVLYNIMNSQRALLETFSVDASSISVFAGTLGIGTDTNGRLNCLLTINNRIRSVRADITGGLYILFRPSYPYSNKFYSGLYPSILIAQNYHRIHFSQLFSSP